MKHKTNQHADICLILEGTFPYITGGVSSWVYDLILNQPDKTFSILTIIPPKQKLELKYEIPKNVISINNLVLYDLPKGKNLYSKEKSQILSKKIYNLLKNIILKKDIKALENLLDFIKHNRNILGKRNLINSNLSWQIIVNMYNDLMPNSSFSDFFWSWNSLFGGLFSILFAQIPDAHCYHSLCTGYAGILLARAKLEKQKPCFVTEHGIYTNERRIEIATASWLYDQKQFSLSINSKDNVSYGLQQLWTEIFSNYSYYCYQVCDYIITLYEGNIKLQLIDDAPYEKIKIIPNGIDFERFSQIEPVKHDRPAIALIGRVVPIKGVKTYIKAVSIVKQSIPNILAYVMGPTSEDQSYYEECVEMVKYEGLNKNITFTGKVKIDDYLGKIDIVVLTSLSEAQPLVILECGSAGIPTVATNVGACSEMIFGKEDESPKLGSGGGITPLSNAKSTALEIIKLLTDYNYYNECSCTIKKRVDQYYKKEDQHSSYSLLYNELIQKSKYRN